MCSTNAGRSTSVVHPNTIPVKEINHSRTKATIHSWTRCNSPIDAVQEACVCSGKQTRYRISESWHKFYSLKNAGVSPKQPAHDSWAAGSQGICSQSRTDFQRQVTDWWLILDRRAEQPLVWQRQLWVPARSPGAMKTGGELREQVGACPGQAGPAMRLGESPKRTGEQAGNKRLTRCKKGT